VNQPARVISAVAGVPVGSVVAPATVGDLCFALAEACASDQAVCIAGGGSKLDIGAAPARLDQLIATTRLDQLIEYNPHDLVVRAQAGLPLAALQSVVGESGQRLALDPPEDGATLGGVVAANASGPRRHRFGTARDLLIGATFVLVDGTVAHTGGKVVKNVAGYDLAKLLTGSYGTLAVLADVTFRLHGLPAASIAVHTPVASITEVERVLACYRSSYLEPSALELQFALPEATGAVVALFEGRPETISAHADDAIALVGNSQRVEWSEPDQPWRGDAMGLRVAFPPAALGAVLRAVAVLPGPATVSGRAGLGVLELATAPDAAVVVTLREALAPLDGTVVVVVATPALKAEVDVWGPIRGLSLMRAIKDQFDPGHRLAPGRFAGGI
jgi:glycolate oxidase FAD binding subunit